MSASQYERELKGILEGDAKIISKITKTCTTFEKDKYLKISNRPFAVIRAAGSLGIDLVAVRGDVTFLTEVKTSFDNTLHFSSNGGKPQKQAEHMIKICEKTKTLPVYAFRVKNIRGDNWRIFTLDIKGLEGRFNVVQNRLPKIKRSNNGNFVMRWEEGMPLSDFISYLCK